MYAADPNYSDTYLWRAAFARFSGDADAAIRYLHQGRRLNPLGSWRFLAGLSRTHLQAGHYERALDAIKGAIEQAPNGPPNLVVLAAAHALSGQLPEAKEATQRLLKIRKSQGYLATLVEDFGYGALSHPSYRQQLHKGLRLAGIPEIVRAEELALSPEHRIPGAETRGILKNGVRTRGKLPHGEFMRDHFPDGAVIAYWLGKETGRLD